MDRIQGRYELLGAGTYFIALDRPGRDFLIKLERPGGPDSSSLKGRKGWLPAALRRRKRSAHLAHSKETLRMVLELEGFDWQPIVDLQYRLWTVGAGLGMRREIWGPANWCRTPSGTVRIGDISSLTRDRHRIARKLSEATRRQREQRLTRRQPPHCRELVAAYFDFMAQHLSEEALERLWRSSPAL